VLKHFRRLVFIQASSTGDRIDEPLITVDEHVPSICFTLAAG
jgi:hypothetical protein